MPKPTFSNSRAISYLAARRARAEFVANEENDAIGLRVTLHGRTAVAWFATPDLEFCNGPVLKALCRLCEGDSRHSLTLVRAGRHNSNVTNQPAPA